MSANELVTEFLLAAEEGNSDALKPVWRKAWILTPPIDRKEPPLLFPA